MRTLISILIILALAANALAVIDPDPDQVGFYFDFEADVTSYDAESSVPYFIYLILTNPTAATVDGFEFGYRLGHPAGLESLIFQLATTGEPDWNTTNTAVAGQEQEFFATPLVASEATILLTYQYMLLFDDLVEYFVVPTTFGGDGHPVYDSDGQPVPMYPVSGSFDAPVARVNSEAVVATDQATFGALKALYR